jgi:serpin B
MEKGFLMVELPYKDKHVSMIVILPDAGEFEAVEATLDADQFRPAVWLLAPNEITLSMPRFQFEYELPMIPILRTMGITDAFDPNRANFSKLAGSASGTTYVDQAIHKAFISVDEQGAEAAAASAVRVINVSDSGSGMGEIKIDRPFLFAIRDQETGTILFMGRVLNPVQ